MIGQDQPNLKYLRENYSFCGVRNDIVCIFEIMARRFPNCDAKELQENKKAETRRQFTEMRFQA